MTTSETANRPPGFSTRNASSNTCALSADKGQVLKEAFRVLKPGGRFAVSDVVIDGQMPDGIRKDMEAYVGCIAGALDKDEYLRLLTNAGFSEASIEPTRRYKFSDLPGAWDKAGMSDDEKKALDDKIYGGFVRATKPKQ